MQIVIVSDNHGKIKPLQDLIEWYPEATAFIHCGDSELPPEYLEKYISVEGNNDVFYDYPFEQIVTIGEIKALVTHGHRYLFSERLEKLHAQAKRLGCQLVCFGHTHVFYTEQKDGVCIVNPGSIFHNRDGSNPSYAVVTYEDGVFQVERKEYEYQKKERKSFFGKKK